MTAQTTDNRQPTGALPSGRLLPSSAKYWKLFTALIPARAEFAANHFSKIIDVIVDGDSSRENVSEIFQAKVSH